jgi:hypothetical protein
MKLAQFFDNDNIHLGIVENNKIIPLDFKGDFHAWLAAGRPPTTSAFSLQFDQANLCAPVNRPGKIIAIGLNYADHAAEGKVEKPEEPLIVRLDLDHEKMRILEELYRLAQQNPGRKQLKLRLCSKLQEVEIASPVRVNAEFAAKVRALEMVEVLESAS